MKWVLHVQAPALHALPLDSSFPIISPGSAQHSSCLILCDCGANFFFHVMGATHHSASAKIAEQISGIYSIIRTLFERLHQSTRSNEHRYNLWKRFKLIIGLAHWGDLGNIDNVSKARTRTDQQLTFRKPFRLHPDARSSSPNETN